MCYIVQNIYIDFKASEFFYRFLTAKQKWSRLKFNNRQKNTKHSSIL